MHWTTGEKPTLVFSWHEGRRFAFGLTAKKVVERFGPGDNHAAWKLARKNYRASQAASRVVEAVRFINED